MVAKADWIADSGYAQLSAELGPNLPTGAGITILQTEANASGSSGSAAFMPQASSVSPFSGAGNYSGKTFTVDSTLGDYSSHADTVGTHFYGNSGSVAPGVTDVHLMLADDFFYNLFDTTGPPTTAGSVQNHSWIAGTTSLATQGNDILRAFDYMINRDNVVSCVPLNNGTGPLPIFLPNSYHAISVGLLNGNHSQGGTTADGTGRMKPDLVVNESETSYASPSVASCVTLLSQAINANFPTANHPQAIKALFLAAASKDNLPAWHRAASTAPYDNVFGAGELNVLNAYHILANGSQTPSGSTEVAPSGWNYNTTRSSSARRYFFTVPNGALANTFSAALTWHRNITRISNNYTSTLPNLTLTLYASSGFTVGAVIDQSNSTLDNVQHLFQRNLPAGQYALEVSSSTNNLSYGLAWQSQLGLGPTSSVAISSGSVSLNMANLDPYVTYTIQQSSDLINWTNATTILTSSTTASTTAAWQDTSADPDTPKFYRLQWTAVR
jgi:hypothetical protein